MRRRWIIVGAFVVGCACAQAQPIAPKATPPTLQPAPEKLRGCANEWIRMKRIGEASGKLWRDFWEVCGKK